MPKVGFKHSAETRQKMSDARKGMKFSEEHKRKMRENHVGFKGKKHSEEAKMRQAMIGEKNPAWRGGLTSKNVLIRRSARYEQWRTAVFERDNYACIWCGISGSKTPLQADHIKPFALFEDLRFKLSNGRTLCIPCHKTTGTWGHKTMSKTGHHKEVKL